MTKKLDQAFIGDGCHADLPSWAAAPVNEVRGVCGRRDIADVIRFMQDQPIVYLPSNSLAPPEYNFVNSVANFVQNIGKITDKQIAGVRKVMARQGWREPPRWRPFWDVRGCTGEYVAVVWLCPGTCPTEEEIAEFGVERDTLFAADAITGVKCVVGPLIEYTQDAYDPRLTPNATQRAKGKQARYRTLLHQLAARAERAGSTFQPAPPPVVVEETEIVKRTP